MDLTQPALGPLDSGMSFSVSDKFEESGVPRIFQGYDLRAWGRGVRERKVFWKCGAVEKLCRQLGRRVIEKCATFLSLIWVYPSE